MSKNNYFKGWYFKCCANDTTIAFIPAYHHSNHKRTASLQIITDDSVFNIPFTSLEYTEKPLCVNIGKCVFSENGRMNRIIHESASCRAYYNFSCKGKPLCEFTSDRASFEFEYARF
jgi:hypothetical protein